MGWGVLGSNFGGRVCVPVIVLFLFYVNVSGMPPFDDTGSLGSPRQVVYSPWLHGSTLGDCPRFLVGNREADLKATTFSLLLFRVFRVFLSFLFS